VFINSVFLEFLKFVAFYLILKALIQLINLEARRTGLDVLAGVSGLFA
jgi:Na+-translocating ferredoxin:NAD+ oxidoreductase RnfA subunit